MRDYQAEPFASLVGKKFPVLDQGSVRLLDVMGTDADIAAAARTSYGKGTRKVSEDRDLIRYLMRNSHTSPFEMAELKFYVRVPMDCWRQWIRHRMASVNEYSTRYSEAIDAMQETPPHGWRLQSKDNKQGSAGEVDSWPGRYDLVVDGDFFSGDPAGNHLNFPNPDGKTTSSYWEPTPITPGTHLSRREAELHDLARRTYRERLDFGVAREQARKDLPLSTYTEAVWKIDLHNLLHFLRLRLDPHAQREIRLYAEAIAGIVEAMFPITWEAFADYRLNSMTLSAVEISAIAKMIALDAVPEDILDETFSNSRELSECLAKLVCLNLIPREAIS